MTEPRKRGPLDADFERGYRPIDEPPGIEEAEYQRWKVAGGKVMDHLDIVAEIRLKAAAPALLRSCKELFALAVNPGNYTEAHRQLILTEARAALKAAE